MSYIKAEEILPKELLESIQEYVDGSMIYIPRKDHVGEQPERKRTPYQEELCRRNGQIRTERKMGVSIESLAEKYFLSKKSIERILRSKE